MNTKAKLKIPPEIMDEIKVKLPETKNPIVKAIVDPYQAKVNLPQDVRNELDLDKGDSFEIEVISRKEFKVKIIKKK